MKLWQHPTASLVADCSLLCIPSCAVNDPLLSEDARELLAALAAVPACLPALQARMLPTLCAIIGAPAQHSSILVDGALELITLVLGPSPPEIAAQIHAAATPAALALLASSDDAEVLRSATSYLRTLLQVGLDIVTPWIADLLPPACLRAHARCPVCSCYSVAAGASGPASIGVTSSEPHPWGCAAASPASLPLLLLLFLPSRHLNAPGAVCCVTSLQVGGAAVLQWGGGTPADALASLLQPVQRLLDPTLEDHACDQVP